MSEKIKQPDLKEQELGAYSTIMDSYHNLTQKLRALERHHPADARDNAIKFKITEIDKDRHNLHLKAVEIAEKLGKTKDDVLIDIIRWDNSLSEYGLPEFSILKNADIVETGGFHSAIQFNINETEGVPSEPTPLDKQFTDYGDKENVIEENEVLLLFSIVPVEGSGERRLQPEDYDKRDARAESLAKEVGGKYFNQSMGGYHATSADVIGVVIPKEKLQKVAEVIRDNPKKFRLGKEFY